MSRLAVVERLDVDIRRAGEQDWNYIHSSWKKSHALSWYRRNKPWLRQKLHSPEFDELYSMGMDSVIMRLRKKPSVIFVVAVYPGDDEFIVGWACLGDGVVHYVYVRESMRRAGVATRLIGDRFRVLCTHWTTCCEAIDQVRPGVLSYRPELL